MYTHSPNPNSQFQAVGVHSQSPHTQVDANASWNFSNTYVELGEPANALMALSGTHGDASSQAGQQAYGGLIPEGLAGNGRAQQWPEGTWNEEGRGE